MLMHLLEDINHLLEFVRPLLEYCSTVWNPFIHAKYYLGMTDELENIQRYFTRRLYYRCRLDCNHDYMARINHLQLESLELRRIYNDMTMVFKIVHKFTDLNDSNLLIMCNTTHNTRGHAFKLKTRSFRLDIARNQFCNRVVPLWNSLPAHVVNKPSPKLFKAALRNIDFTHADQKFVDRSYLFFLYAIFLNFFIIIITFNVLCVYIRHV